MHDGYLEKDSSTQSAHDSTENLIKRRITWVNKVVMTQFGSLENKEISI